MSLSDQKVQIKIELSVYSFYSGLEPKAEMEEKTFYFIKYVLKLTTCKVDKKNHDIQRL